MEIKRIEALVHQLAGLDALLKRQTAQAENIHGFLSEAGVKALKTAVRHGKVSAERIKAELRHLLA